MHEASHIVSTLEAENIIMYCARVSNPSNQDSGQTGLLKYCIREKHWSPFEMADMLVEINTTRAISAQILRHRSFCFQEFSQRYAEPNTLFKSGIPLPNLRRQDTKNRQASHDDLPSSSIEAFHAEINHAYEWIMSIYNDMIKQGVAKECAREILPLGIPTRIYMKGNLRSWITYIALREKNGTQLEHQMIANSCKKIFAEQFPVISDALGGADCPWLV